MATIKESQFVKQYFYGLNELKMAIEDADSMLKRLKFGFTVKVDKKKVMELLDKLSKPPSRAKGQFYIVRSDFKVALVMRVNGSSSNQQFLNSCDIGAIKDPVKRREMLGDLNRSFPDLVSEQDLADYDKANADPEDSDVAIAINKKIDELENALENYKGTLTAGNYKNKEYNEYNSDFADWVKKKGYIRFTAFVDDTGRGRLSNDAGKLLDDPKTSGIGTATLAKIKAAMDAGKTPDFKEARKDVLKKINTFMLPVYNKEKIDEYNKKIKAATEEIDKLHKQLKALKAD